jgi:hypothetical protein
MWKREEGKCKGVMEKNLLLERDKRQDGVAAFRQAGQEGGVRTEFAYFCQMPPP